MDLFLNTIPKQVSRCGDGWSSVLFGLSEALLIPFFFFVMEAAAEILFKDCSLFTYTLV